MRSIRHTISLYRIKKDVAKSFAVLLSVGLILSNFNISFAENTYNPLPLYPNFTNDYSITSSYNGGTTWSYSSSGSTTYAIYGHDSSGSTSSNGILIFFTTDGTDPVTYTYTSTSSTSTLTDYLKNNGEDIVLTNGNFKGKYITLRNGWVKSINGIPNVYDVSGVDHPDGIFNYAVNNFDTLYNNPNPTIKYQYTLQNGWLSVIDLGSSSATYNLNLSTQFAEYSHLSQPWWNSTQRYWFSNTLPSDNDSFENNTQGTLISWNKIGKTDIFGRAKSAESNISGTSTARYLYIYNPAYHTFQGLTSVNDEANFPMTISGIEESTDIYIYSTTEQYHLTTGPSTTIGNTTATTTATGSAIDVTDTFENDGQYIAQNSGGGNDLNNSTGIVGYIMNINNVLDNFTNQFINLLSAPISHIQQLISAGTNFFNVFGSLFTWMPAEAYQVIIGAFIVMIVIGIIKLLL